MSDNTQSPPAAPAPPPDPAKWSETPSAKLEIDNAINAAKEIVSKLEEQRRVTFETIKKPFTV